jgi:hypothetical protein
MALVECLFSKCKALSFSTAKKKVLSKLVVKSLLSFLILVEFDVKLSLYTFYIWPNGFSAVVSSHLDLGGSFPTLTRST